MSERAESISEMSESITGYDEIAIEKHMGIDIYTQGEQRPMTMMRSLVFIAFKRDGMSDAQAKEKALGLSVKEINTFFAPEAEEAMPEEPVSIVGKEDLAAV